MLFRFSLLALLSLSGSFIPALTQAQTSLSCTREQGKVITATLAFDGLARRAVSLLLLPGGTAEYTASGTCTILGFTAIRDGEAVYTDDGLGRGLTVSVGKDETLTVTHAAGWTTRFDSRRTP